MPIPRLIHQTAKTAEIPERWQGFQKKLRDLHPAWTYRLWTDDDNRNFVKSHFPEFFDIFQALPKNIMRADVIRYLLMYRLGGLYMDLDYEMLKPFDLLQYEVVLPREACTVQRPETVCNAIFASAPGHPFFKAVIDELRANPPLGPNPDVENATGPGLISRVYRRSKGTFTDIHTPKEEYFSPLSPRNNREYQKIIRAGVAYGIHHCDGTWREYTFRQKYKNIASRLLHRFI